MADAPKTAELTNLVEGLRQSLNSVPFLALQAGRAGQGAINWTLPAQIGSDVYDLGVLAVHSAQPRQTRSAVFQLRAWAGARADRVGILVAPYISPESAAILQEAGLGYLDLSGNCRLTFDHVHIQRESFPNRFTKRRPARSVFTPKAERILRTLLRDPKRAWKLQALAKESRVSLGQAHSVVNFMHNQEWLRRDEQGLRLAQPETLVAEWVRNYRRDRSVRREYHSLAEVHDTELAIARACGEIGADYAFTGFSAGARLAPMVRYQRISAYVAGESDEIARRAGLKPVTSGANVTLLVPYDEQVLADATIIDGLKVVSPLQAYLDLHAISARGEEAAQAIYEQVLRRSW